MLNYLIYELIRKVKFLLKHVKEGKMPVRKLESANMSRDYGKRAKGKLSFRDLSIHVPSSLQNNYQQKRPLKQYSRELSFKGLSLSNIKVNNASKVLEKVSSVLGNTFEQKYAELSKTYAKRIIKNGDSVEFVRKSIPRMTLESLAYPFVKMPFDIADFGLKLLGKIPGLKKTANAIYNSKFLTSKRMSTIREEEFNAVMGMFDQVSKKMKNTSDKSLDNWIFTLSQKYFSPETGKYNSVHERSLNRIVSGMIPAFFLANDAYNLSRFCDDNSEMAQKEHDTRFKQELSRVGITAYIQLVILGGLTKFVNSSLTGTALASTLPVLIAETSSRLANGKSITFISKDKAQQMAQQQGVIKIDNKKDDKNDLIYQYYPMPVAFNRTDRTFAAFKGNSAAFSSFVPKTIMDQTAGIVGQVTAQRDNENKNTQKDKGLLSVGMIKKAILTSIAVGFAVKYARKNAKIDKSIKSFFGFFKDNYDKLVKKDFVITKSEFTEITTKLKNAGFDKVAQKYTELMQTHSEDSVKLASLLQDLLANLKTPKAKQIFADNAELFKKHGVNASSSKIVLAQRLKSLKATTDDIYRLGRIDKKIKPAVDFVIAPFKFMWGAIKFPYHIVNTIVGTLSKQTKKSKETSIVKMMTKSLMDIQESAKKMSPAEFKNYIEKMMCASFNNTTKSDYSNADLGKLTKLFASTVTTWFLIADDYNMVMMKSLGQDSSGASLKAKERFQQRITGIFYQTLFIDLFNNTFRKLYHASLLGMSAVTSSCSLVCEVFTRKSIGKPVGHMSRDEINALEYANNNAPGLKGKYFRFMTALTGKKAVSEDATKKKVKSAA